MDLVFSVGQKAKALDLTCISKLGSLLLLLTDGISVKKTVENQSFKNIIQRFYFNIQTDKIVMKKDNKNNMVL
jgi:hypothetical protein